MEFEWLATLYRVCLVSQKKGIETNIFFDSKCILCVESMKYRWLAMQIVVVVDDKPLNCQSISDKRSTSAFSHVIMTISSSSKIVFAT